MAVWVSEFHGRSGGYASVVAPERCVFASETRQGRIRIQPPTRIRLLRRATASGTDGSGGTDAPAGADAMSPRAFTGNRVRWEGGIVS